MIISVKEQIRRNFNSVPTSYDQASDWQQCVGDRLLDWIDQASPINKTIIDLGSGTSYLAKHIRANHPNNTLIAMDLAENMLKFSKESLPDIQHICADAENLSLCDQSVDLIASNMALHWCSSFSNMLSELHRVLKPGGKLIFSVMGIGSLRALQKAWEGVDRYSHTNPFLRQSDIRNDCKQSGFKIINIEKQHIKKYYSSVYELMHHFKQTGARNISTNKPRGLTGKNKLNKLIKSYENPLIYEVLTIFVQKER